MVAENEIRIGNWFKISNDAITGSEFPGTVFQFSPVHWHDIATGKLFASDLEAIPLSETVLVQCGALHKKEMFAFIFGHHLIEEIENGFCLHPRFTNDKDCHIKIGTLHHLQNWIFYNDGEDVEYNHLSL